MRRAWIVGVLMIAAVGYAEAGPLADAIARHANADVDGLRARLPGDASVRCTLGTVYAKRGDLPRADLYLIDCADAALPDDIAAAVLRATRETRRLLRDSQLAELSLMSRPSGMTVELDGLVGEKLITPATVWVKAGLHTVTATGNGTTIRNTVTTQPYSRATIWLDAGPVPAAPRQDNQLDFSDDNARETPGSGPPPDIKHPSLLSEKYRGVASSSDGAKLEDPLATMAAAEPLAMWLGLRLGGGLFDDATASANLRPSVAAAARFEVGRSMFMAARIDWTRRGGASTDPGIDTLGASAGVGTTVLDRTRLAIALIGQLRGDLRFAEQRDAMPVRRAGAGLAAGIEIAFPTTPLTAGVRFEQSLTELVAGARDRALLLELGVDWR